MNTLSPWHAGERQLQHDTGVAERMEVVGAKVIRDHLIDQHREFYPLLPYVVVGAVDDNGLPWATLLEGAPGFAHSPDPYVLRIDSLPAAQDPLAATLKAGALDGQGFAVNVVHSYGNCPKYIQLRTVSAGVSSVPGNVQRFTGLDEAARRLIRNADTLFVASYVDLGPRSVDVSHRGGPTGFVSIDGNTLTIPDFVGNSFFNTLGNLSVNPVAGLLFIDFESGEMLQLVGRAQVRVTQEARDWTVSVEQVIRRPAGLSLRWQFEAFSPFNLPAQA
ncbi:MAG: hypothetical protein GAK32_00449 [Pseudomonas fluorescens]|nr:MAG: hypothetical protein GAK32_00449 [Pseudomonas fluorescens]